MTLEGHRIEPGVSTDYNALEVMRAAGAPEDLLALAREDLEARVPGYCGAKLTN